MNDPVQFELTGRYNPVPNCLKSNIAHPKADNCPSSASHFSPFNCCLSVIL